MKRRHLDTDDERPGTRGLVGRAGAVELRLVLLLGVIVSVGIPFVAVLWETLNEVLAGHIDGQRLLIAVPVLAVFLGILTLAGRALGRYDRSS